jgi:hypothetical protein
VTRSSRLLNWRPPSDSRDDGWTLGLEAVGLDAKLGAGVELGAGAVVDVEIVRAGLGLGSGIGMVVGTGTGVAVAPESNGDTEFLDFDFLPMFGGVCVAKEPGDGL